MAATAVGAGDEAQRPLEIAAVVIVVSSLEIGSSLAGGGDAKACKSEQNQGKGDELALPVDLGEMDGSDSEKVCRICHLIPDRGAAGSDLIWLGCGCKGDLGTAHRHCAEAWFRIKGNRNCEICGVNAKNITGKEDASFMEEWHEGRVASSDGGSHMGSSSERGGSCWRGKPFCNFLTTCLIIAFVLPWFFRVNILSL